MPKPSFNSAIDEILQDDQRFDREAYSFVREGLDFTVKMLKKKSSGQPAQRHVSGQQLLEGLRQFALEQFGPMTKTVLAHWGICQCEDFGEIVFNMVDRGLLGKTDQDSREDFKGGYNFEEAFVKPYIPERRSPARRNRGRNTETTERPRQPRRKTNPEKLSSGQS